ncbi:fatty acid-binding protein 12 [Elysia marginata]|uniref:Fatty acid-binding protein 12 n=1 Tax=Elysia marginata TaxID=1093978 RepID=A0AAV4JL73_9GAST|nr:fatty acid-binding protein 12 [Elysia marginata]
MDGALGTWRTDVARCEKLVELSLTSGVPKELCTEENLGKCRVHVSMDGDYITSKTEMPGMPTKEIKYKMGEPFEMETPKGKFKVREIF